MKKLYVWVDGNEPFTIKIKTRQDEEELEGFINWVKIIDEWAKNVVKIGEFYFVHRAIKAFKVVEVDK